ncbi:MAG: Uma2 family endonuclease [Planctomycetaceae bacterium]
MSIFQSSEPKVKVRLTYDDLVQFPEDGRRHEIIDGVHYMSPSPVPYHQVLSRELLIQLCEAFREIGLGQVFHAPIDVQFSEHDVVEPDLIVVLNDNPIVTESRIVGVPDLLIEILSPSTSDRDRNLKKRLYESYGAPEYWIVDPDRKVVQQYVFEGAAYAEPVSCPEQITYRGVDNVVVDLLKIW